MSSKTARRLFEIQSLRLEPKSVAFKILRTTIEPAFEVIITSVSPALSWNYDSICADDCDSLVWGADDRT